MNQLNICGQTLNEYLPYAVINWRKTHLQSIRNDKGLKQTGELELYFPIPSWRLSMTHAAFRSPWEGHVYGVSDTSLCLRAFCRSFHERGSWRKNTGVGYGLRAANGSPNPLEIPQMAALAEPGDPPTAGKKVGPASQKKALKAQTRSAFIATQGR